ncbi:MAG TPA: SigE family RNA polymerase sigma factor [Marmoricola sp.]|nr:SigE family RNA polymerase sigma factor [Marmoricola sp.]
MLAAAEEAAIQGFTGGSGTGDADAALEQLYAGHYARLVRLAVLLLRDQGVAEDVVQDSFVAVHRQWERIDPDKAAAYLRRTVVNQSRSALRRRSVAMRHRPEPVPAAPAADESVLRAERRDAVLHALAALPARQREVLALRYYLDLSEAEIASTLGISRGAVKSHASRGAAALRARLSPEED